MLTIEKKIDKWNRNYYLIATLGWYYFYLPSFGKICGYIIMPGPKINNKYVVSFHGGFPFYPLNTKHGWVTLWSHFAKFLDHSFCIWLNRIGIKFYFINELTYSVIVKKQT